MRQKSMSVDQRGTAGSTSMPELTVRGMILGALITLIFTSSNVYLGLKVGLTFASSIPAAVISMAVLSFFARSNILENNMVQTQASAAGTLSSVIFVLPAILMISYWSDFKFWETMMICLSGGCLGVIFSIPLRRVMVVKSTLPYPEGVAAAEILLAGHDKETKREGGARDILFGGIFAAIVNFCTSGLQLMSDSAAVWFSSGRAIFQLPMGFSLALLSAGYLMGLTAGIAMLIGTVVAWGGFVPYFTSQLPDISGDIASIAMGVWREKVRFIGAGTLAIGAVWTLLMLFRPMIEGVRLSFRAIRDRNSGASVDRTDLDMSMQSLLALVACLVLVMAGTFYSFVSAAPISPWLAWGLVLFAVLAAVLIGFFVAAACGYMAGLIGSSNSPISGIGIIAIVITSVLLVFLDSGMGIFTSPEGKKFGMALAIFITTAVVSVAAISNDNLQDLKTGQLVNATPKNQQIALLIGCVVGSIVIAPTLGLLYEAYGFAGAPLPRPGMDPADVLSAPQATLMMTVAKGIFGHGLDWSMLGIGVLVGAVFICLDVLFEKNKSRMRVPVLAVGLGIYLPPSIQAAVIVGSLVNVAVKKRLRAKDAANNTSRADSNKRGVLIASGFIVGESLMGVALAILILVSLSMGYSDAPLSLKSMLASVFGGSVGAVQDLAGLTVFVIACAVFFRKST